MSALFVLYIELLVLCFLSLCLLQVLYLLLKQLGLFFFIGRMLDDLFFWFILSSGFYFFYFSTSQKALFCKRFSGCYQFFFFHYVFILFRGINFLLFEDLLIWFLAVFLRAYVSRLWYWWPALVHSDQRLEDPCLSIRDYSFDRIDVNTVVNSEWNHLAVILFVLLELDQKRPIVLRIYRQYPRKGLEICKDIIFESWINELLGR